MMAVPDPCPDCGGERAARICPRCLIRLGLDAPGLSLSSPSGPGVMARLEGGPTRAGVLETLAHSIGPVPRVLLRDTATSGGTEPVVRVNSPEMPGSAEYAGRLQLFGEIARGGMGAVLKGRDNDLGRDLAIKVLLERHGDDPDLLRRFVEEAQIAGQLQHPGIVPVYELGTFADRRPYFAMKLVKGRTLAEVMAERHDASGDRPRLLAIFLDVAQTMAYAHARGVIHRDLKPSNIMVGSFGEVQVMDWGLAKVLGRGGMVDDREAGKLPPQETVITTRRRDPDSDADRSQAGSVLGTPSYMAPEQARGENEGLDERSDVFALGSILCEILTGSPAFTGRTSGEILRRAARGELDEANRRLDGCGADADLVAMTREALAPEADGRLTHAGAIADRLTAHFSGVLERLRAAEMAQVAETARAEEAKRTAEEARRAAEAAEARAKAERRSRRLTVALAASVLGIVAVGGVGASAYLQQRQARLASVARSLGEAETLLARAAGQPDDPARWREATAAADRVESAPLDDASGRERLARVKSEAEAGLRDAERDAGLRRELVGIRAGKQDAGPSGTDAAYERAFREAGLDLKALGIAEAAARLKRRTPAVAVELAAYLDDWAATRSNARRMAPEARASLEVARIADPDPFRDRVRALILSADGKARAEGLRALAEDPRTGELPAATAVLLASAIGEPQAQAALLRKAVVRHPGDVWVNFNLAGALSKLRPSARVEAVRYYTAARALRPETSHNLAHQLDSMGRGDEAEATFRDLAGCRPEDVRNLACFGRLLKEHGRAAEAGPILAAAIAAGRAEVSRRPDIVVSHFHLAAASAAMENYDEAAAEWREAARLDPANASARLNLGIMLYSLGKWDESAAVLREAIRLHPDDAAMRYQLGVSLANLGNWDEAISEFREAARLEPDDSKHHRSLGAALKGQGKVDEAIAESREAIRLKPDNFDAHDDLGACLESQGRPGEAILEYREAIRINPASFVSHTNLGKVLFMGGETGEAVAEWREAARLKPDNAAIRGNLGRGLIRQGRWDEAAVELREATRLAPDTFADWEVLASILYRSRRWDELLGVFREEIRLKPDDSTLHFNLGSLLADIKHDYPAAEAEFREAIRHDPDNSLAHIHLGRLLGNQGQWDKAVAEWREAVRLKPDDAIANYYLGVFLIKSGKPDKAVVPLREAVRLDGDHLGEAIWLLGDTLRDLDRCDEAEATYRRAREIGRVSPADVAKADSRIAEAERIRGLVGRLDAMANGDDRPADADEFRSAFEVCKTRGRFLTAVRISARAFASNAQLADDLKAAHRYDAACCAAMVGCGKGKDAPLPDNDARADLRLQARDWLKADLALRVAAIHAGTPDGVQAARKALDRWKSAPDFNGVRQAEALARLPEAERAEWRAFWAEVDTRLAEAGGEKPKS